VLFAAVLIAKGLIAKYSSSAHELLLQFLSVGHVVCEARKSATGS